MKKAENYYCYAVTGVSYLEDSIRYFVTADWVFEFRTVRATFRSVFSYTRPKTGPTQRKAIKDFKMTLMTCDGELTSELHLRATKVGITIAMDIAEDIDRQEEEKNES